MYVVTKKSFREKKKTFFPLVAGSVSKVKSATTFNKSIKAHF